ncbi:DUF5787 family protein [Halorarius litoreus]|uniref:DUF5787 family protein n=1 Tax=Halorarius litoreus TaxID=2962676 RepID=UPI0020CC5040|nr:DUF5787 family protein [Halorarius litoreus]
MDEPEFLFELRVCRWAEQYWPPDGERRDSAVLVARQLGTRGRRWDTIVLECDPDGLDARAVFGEERLDSDLLHVVQHAPASWAWYRDALPDPGYPWRYVREAVHEAADRGLVETRDGTNGRIELRRKYRYPEWVRRIIAIENKPDLDASAARVLGDQLERDVALGLADEVWVATRATGADVEPALYERLPVEAGILAVGDDSVDVAWNATSLAVDAPGTRILERPSGNEHDQSAARFEYADPAWKADKRLQIAERAYERGWRSFVDTMRPDCRHFELRDPDLPLPYCAAKGRHVTAGECRHACSERSPEPPAWRTNGWPIEGGPGAALKRLLADQRASRR